MSTLTEQAGGPRAAILTVDDDPAVSRAVARDLRRRYGDQYRIVRAESAASALEALREMKLRGDLVAAILADYRMPEVSGIEFLEQAMDIYPGRGGCCSPPTPTPEPRSTRSTWSTWTTTCSSRGTRRRRRRVTFADGTFIDSQTVILATGVSYQKLDVPGPAELTGRGVYYGSALTEASACSGQDVHVVGGANSAGQAALYLSRFAKSVTLLVRGPSLEKSMSYYLIKRITDSPSISVRTSTEVIGASGQDHLERLTLRDTAHGLTETVDAQWLYLFIGAEPLTGWLDGVVVRDARGFVLAGPDLSPGGERPRGWPLDRMPYHLETSVPGVFVAGDARAESAKRVASAVGEGAMSVMLVHRYLEKL